MSSSSTHVASVKTAFEMAKPLRSQSRSELVTLYLTHVLVCISERVTARLARRLPPRAWAAGPLIPFTSPQVVSALRLRGRVFTGWALVRVWGWFCCLGTGVVVVVICCCCCCCCCCISEWPPTGSVLAPGPLVLRLVRLTATWLHTARPSRMPTKSAPRVPCSLQTEGYTRSMKDTPFEACDDFCSARFFKSHCRMCKCRSCAFCRTVSNATATQRDQQMLLQHAERISRGHVFSAEWCDAALMHTPTHLFHRMWAVAPWTRMEPGDPACWERRRSAPDVRRAPRVFFRQAENGTFCQSNWYEGHKGPLGDPTKGPSFAEPAHALLGYDSGIYEHCAKKVSLRGLTCPNDPPGHVARCCVMAGFNILNMVGHHPQYNLCRNLEWQLCGIFGKLPGQGGDHSVRFANAPRELDVDPLVTMSRRKDAEEHQAPRHRCEQQTRSTRMTSNTTRVKSAKKRLGYSLPDIFHLEVCIFHQICTNGRDIFRLKVGEPFVCRFSHERFTALADVLLAPPPAPEADACNNIMQR